METNQRVETASEGGPPQHPSAWRSAPERAKSSPVALSPPEVSAWANDKAWRLRRNGTPRSGAPGLASSKARLNCSTDSALLNGREPDHKVNGVQFELLELISIHSTVGGSSSPFSDRKARPTAGHGRENEGGRASTARALPCNAVKRQHLQPKRYSIKSSYCLTIVKRNVKDCGPGGRSGDAQ